MPLDAFAERIPYRETRNYVKNILASYRVYRSIYSEDLPILATELSPSQIAAAPSARRPMT